MQLAARHALWLLAIMGTAALALPRAQERYGAPGASDAVAATVRTSVAQVAPTAATPYAMRTPPSHEALLANVEAQIRSLDARLVEEPLDAAWSAREERSIHRFFEPGSLVAEGLAKPDAADGVCMSTTCRITARYANEADAEEATQRLAMHLADAMPYGAVMPRQLADGAIEVNAWYSSRPLQP